MQVTVFINDGEITGFDSCIAAAPPWMADETAPLDMVSVMRHLGQLTVEGADGVNERVHHADWVMTSDPEVVMTRGLGHDCVTCRAGVDQALAFMRDNPDRKILVGLLYYTD